MPLVWLEPPPDTVIDEIVKQAMLTCHTRGLDAKGTIREMAYLLVAEMNGQLATKYQNAASDETKKLTRTDKTRITRWHQWMQMHG